MSPPFLLIKNRGVKIRIEGRETTISDRELDIFVACRSMPRISTIGDGWLARTTFANKD